MSMKASPVSNPPSVTRDAAPSLLNDQERRLVANRKRAGRIFAVLCFVPVVLALILIALLFLKTASDTVSWQVVEPANSGQTFPWRAAPLGGLQVVRLELAAQGLSEQAIGEQLDEAEERRLMFARNRVELMWYTQDGPFRWVVTNMRDRRVTDHDVVSGWRNLTEIRQNLGEGQNLYLNPWLDVAFLKQNASRTPVMAGLRTALLGTLWVLGLVLLLALPLGVGTAIYLEEYAPNNRFTRFLEVNIRNLAGVPSIIYGILGLYVFVRLSNLGPSVLAAAFTLTLLILPVVIIAAREAIRAVPSSLRQASYGLGATRWQTISRIVLPNAVPGIMTGLILAIARAIGETAPLLLVGAAAFVPYLPQNVFSAYTVIPVQIYSWISEAKPEFYHIAAAAIITLLVILLVLYGVAFYVRRHYERKW